MNPLFAALQSASSLLRASDKRWALVGGLAVSARTEPRFTRDVDLVVVVADDADAERLVMAFTTAGHVATTAVEQEAVGRLATVRLAAPEGIAAPLFVDLLFASSGIEAEVAAEAEPLDLAPGLLVPVAQAGHLVALKLLSRDAAQPQDEMDLASLRRVLDAPERARGVHSVKLIQDRGFARGKSLVEELEAFLR